MGFYSPSSGYLTLKADLGLTRRARAPGRCNLGRERQAPGSGNSHTFSGKYRKYTKSRTQLRNKPTLIESVHRDMGKQGCDQVRPATHLSWPRYLVHVEDWGWGWAGAQKQGRSSCLEQQGSGKEWGGAELRPGTCISVCSRACVGIYMSTMYTESTGALRGRFWERDRETTPQIPRVPRGWDGIRRGACHGVCRMPGPNPASATHRLAV